MIIRLEKNIKVFTSNVVAEASIQTEREEFKEVLSNYDRFKYLSRLNSELIKLKLLKDGVLTEKGKLAKNTGIVNMIEYADYNLLQSNDEWIPENSKILALKRNGRHDDSWHVSKHRISEPFELYDVNQRKKVIVDDLKIMSETNPVNASDLSCEVVVLDIDAPIIGDLHGRYSYGADEYCNLDLRRKLNVNLRSEVESCFDSFDFNRQSIILFEPPTDSLELSTFMRSQDRGEKNGVKCTLEDVPLIASDRNVVQRWIVALAKDKWSKHRISPERLKADQEVWLEALLPESSMDPKSLPDMLNDLQGSKAYWKVASAHDLIPDDNKPVDDLPFTIKKGENPIPKFKKNVVSNTEGKVTRVYVIDSYVSENFGELMREMLGPDVKISLEYAANIRTNKDRKQIMNNIEKSNVDCIPFNKTFDFHDRYILVFRGENCKVWNCSNSFDTFRGYLSNFTAARSMHISPEFFDDLSPSVKDFIKGVTQ